jgi:hypothetical protein
MAVQITQSKVKKLTSTARILLKLSEVAELATKTYYIKYQPYFVTQVKHMFLKISWSKIQLHEVHGASWYLSRKASVHLTLPYKGNIFLKKRTCGNP